MTSPVRRAAASIAVAMTAAAAAALFSADEAPFDLVIRRARIVDGAGGPWFRGDVAVRGGRIARVGRVEARHAAREIDAADRVLAPGFIDVHMHVESELPVRPDAENLVADGVTSIVTGNCGASETRLSDWFGRLRTAGIAVNVASLVGHNSIRRDVVGAENRPPSARELASMQSLVHRAMEEGAVGLSTGLIYVPGSFAAPEEVAALAKTAGASGGIYATHMRSENERVLEAIDESLAAARSAQPPLEISHFKVTAKPLWGLSVRMLEKVENARTAGVDVTLDWYPYTATSTTLDVLLPNQALAAGPEGSRKALAKRLKSPRQRRAIAEEMFDRIHGALGRDHLDYAVVAVATFDASLAGKSLREINLAAGGARADTLRSEIETVLDLCARGAAFGRGSGACGAHMVFHVLDEGDIERIFASPLTMVGRDGGVPEPGVEKPHPRSYGTAARVLARYVRERGVVRLEEAVRRMTSLPAQRFGFSDIGLVREGFRADLVLFDPAQVQDLATFEDPHQLSRGFDVVLVDGRFVRDGGRPTGARPGRILYGPGFTGPAAAGSSTSNRPPGPSGAVSRANRR
jgi:N-acyl-D-amino-acid deacylase